MLDSIKREVTQHLMAVQIRSQEQVQEAERKAEEAAQALKNVQYHHADFNEAVAQADGDPDVVNVPSESAAPAPAEKPFVRPMQKVGRNDPCPCGSGKKYKNCHGKLT